MTNPDSGIRYRFTRCVTDPAVAGSALSVPNYGLNTEAPRDVVIADRIALRDDVGVPIVWMRQIHSDIITEVDVSNASNENSVTADAVISGDRIALAVQVADCVPVLLKDRKRNIVAAVHAGRAGVEKAIVAKTVSRMVDMGCSARDIVAAIGPSICGSCYEVSRDLFDEVVSKRPEVAAETSWGTPALNNVAGVVKDLVGSGVEEILYDCACTLESADLNSYRRNPKCGRQVGLVINL